MTSYHDWIELHAARDWSGRLVASLFPYGAFLPMGARTSGREAALQILFGLDLTKTEPETALRAFWHELPGDAEGRSYADELVRGVRQELEAVDSTIRAASKSWRLERMSTVDRNVLRLGTWELMQRADVPRAVILDEAVEVAKRYGNEESGAFVNGVLESVADQCGRGRES